MQKMKVSELAPHPQNDYFFDDIVGDAWDEFVKSIATSGIIEPIVATQDKVIVSGHQRIRAAKQLGLDEVLVEIRAFESEDEVTRALIETNIRQRGVGNPNPIKFGRCLMELDRIYGIERGGDRKSKANNSPLKTQSDLARELGIERHTIQNYKTLAQSIPEIQDLLESGKISATSALGIIRHLSEEDQKAIAREIASEDAERITSSQIEELKRKLQEAKDKTDSIKRELSEERVKAIKAKKALEEMEARGPEVVERIPDDYEKLKKENLEQGREIGQLSHAINEERKKVSELTELLGRDKMLQDAERDVSVFTTATNNYIRQYGGHVWAFDQIEHISDVTKQEFIKSIKTLDAFAQQMIMNLEGNIHEQ